ncbi:GNAT family N-acetyltransferase [Chitinimonas sp. BJYL2]|uniref:GNAT family N-acetyltransferase n=1 Tax=Chitinimonas sp. BJYL2 TaxID=2976696 RepID=UPI0022B37008|nr:GNAT family N-acetyltransferase [Chitinimonas sp. BJYL2]
MTGHPAPHLRTDRLVIRLGGLADATAIAAYYRSNRAVLAPLEPRRPESFYTEAYWQARVLANRRQFEEGRSVCLFLYPIDLDVVIGVINFTAIVGYPAYSALLGYSLDQRYWGGGLMTEALGVALDWVWTHHHLHRISANHLPDNERSARVLAKLGFVREGYAPDYLLIDGAWRDHVLTALTRRDWQADEIHAALIGHRPAA